MNKHRKINTLAMFYVLFFMKQVCKCFLTNYCIVFKTSKNKNRFFFTYIDVLNFSVCKLLFFLWVIFGEYQIYVPIFFIYINIIVCVYEWFVWTSYDKSFVSLRLFSDCLYIKICIPYVWFINNIYNRVEQLFVFAWCDVMFNI